jgi:hypothetical protein
MSRAVLIAAVVVALVGCTSPEATRLRAGGQGADPGNRTRVVRMHEGSRPYHGTPRLIANAGLEDLQPARQADALSVERQQAHR